MALAQTLKDLAKKVTHEHQTPFPDVGRKHGPYDAKHTDDVLTPCTHSRGHQAHFPDEGTHLSVHAP